MRCGRCVCSHSREWLERGDRGLQLIAIQVEPMLLNEKTNKPAVLEVLMPARRLSRVFVDQLSGIFDRYHGLDHVELRVEMGSGETMRMELPIKVDAHNTVLRAEVDDLVGREGKVVLA